MGLFDFFKSKKETSEEEFQTPQFQRELLAFSLWKFEEHNSDYEKVKMELNKFKELGLNESQVERAIYSLKKWNKLKEEQELFQRLVNKAKILINAGKDQEAFDLVCNSYLQHKDNIDLVGLLFDIADRYKSIEDVVEILENLKELNPDEKYNIEYRKGLYLKSKKQYESAKIVFLNLNSEDEFAWNYYQLGIIENLQRNTEQSLNYLKKTFNLDPRLKIDAKTFPELENLRENVEFINLIK